MDMDGMRKPAGNVSMEPAIMPRPAPPSRARNLLRQDGERRKDLSSPLYKDEKKSEVSQLAPFSTAFCWIKAAAACKATSSSRRSVPRANRLLNSLSRTCRACKKRRRRKKNQHKHGHYQQDTQSSCGLTSWGQKRTGADGKMSIKAVKKYLPD